MIYLKIYRNQYLITTLNSDIDKLSDVLAKINSNTIKELHS